MKTNKKTVENKSDSTPIKRVGCLKIYPKIKNDTVDGKPIKSGVMFLRFSAANAKLKHEGKNFEVDISTLANGATCLYCNGRFAVLDLKEFISEAIKNGFLADKIDFSEIE